MGRKYSRLESGDGIEPILNQAAHVIDHMSEIAAESKDLAGLEAAANLWMELAKYYVGGEEQEILSESETTSDTEVSDQEYQPMGFRRD